MVIIIIIRQLVHTEGIVNVMRIGSDGTAMGSLEAETQSSQTRESSSIGSKERAERIAAAAAILLPLWAAVTTAGIGVKCGVETQD